MRSSAAGDPHVDDVCSGDHNVGAGAAGHVQCCNTADLVGEIGQRDRAAQVFKVQGRGSGATTDGGNIRRPRTLVDHIEAGADRDAVRPTHLRIVDIGAGSSAATRQGIGVGSAQRRQRVGVGIADQCAVDVGAAGQVFDVGIGIARRIAAGAYVGRQIGSDRAGVGVLIANRIDTGTAVESVETAVGHEGVVAATADRILDIGVGVTVRKRSNPSHRVTADVVVQVHQHTDVGTRIAHRITVGAVTAAVEGIGGGAGKEGVVEVTADEIADAGKFIAGSVTAAGACPRRAGQIHNYRCVGCQIANRVATARATIKTVGDVVGDEDIVEATADQIVDQAQLVSGSIAAGGVAAVSEIQIDRHTGGGTGIAGIGIGVIGGSAEQRVASCQPRQHRHAGIGAGQHVSKCAADNVFHVGIGIACCVTAETCRTAAQIDCHTGIRPGVTDGIKTGAAIKDIGHVVGDESVVEGTTGQIVDQAQLVASGVVAGGAGAVGEVQIHRYPAAGSAVAGVGVGMIGSGALQCIAPAAAGQHGFANVGGGQGITGAAADDVFNVGERVAVREATNAGSAGTQIHSDRNG